MNHQLEHSDEVLTNVHDPSVCKLYFCTIHNMSNHSMRNFPQHWRADKQLMERTCPHGVGHPDPDDPYSKLKYGGIHGCDGCCINPEELWFCSHGKAYAIRCRVCPSGKRQEDSMTPKQYEKWEPKIKVRNVTIEQIKDDVQHVLFFHDYNGTYEDFLASDIDDFDDYDLRDLFLMYADVLRKHNDELAG